MRAALALALALPVLLGLAARSAAQAQPEESEPDRVERHLGVGSHVSGAQPPPFAVQSTLTRAQLQAAGVTS